MIAGGPYVIGCDVGSQGTNSALYAADGTLVASAYEAYDLSFPHPTWAEQDPDLWVTAIERTVARLVAEVPEGASAIKGLSFGSQLDGMVVCDAAGRPVRPAMIWMDRRAEDQSAALAKTMSPETFYSHVGANLDSSHAVFKALWVRDEEPGPWQDAADSPLQDVKPPCHFQFRQTSLPFRVRKISASTRTFRPEPFSA